jgi:hypothetical protein
MSSRCLDTEQANMRAELPCLGTVSDKYRLGDLRESLPAAPYKCLLSVAAGAPGSRMPLGQGLAGVALPILELQAV